MRRIYSARTHPEAGGLMRARLRSRISIFSFALAALVFGAAAEKPAAPSATLVKAAEDYWKFLETESLAIRTREGLPVERMPDLSFDHARSNAAFGESLLKALAPVSESALEEDDRLTLAILRREARQLVDAPANYWLTFPVTPYQFYFLRVNQVFTSHAFKSKGDAD